MADNTAIRDLFRIIWDDQVTQDHLRAVVNAGYEGTYGNITRSTTPMWRSQPFEHVEWEPEISDYMRVSEGL